MVVRSNYEGREQAYVKHVFLANYLEGLMFKTASAYPHVVYVDGYAGPWQSADEKYGDTSFGIALDAMRKAKSSWRARQRNVRMTAYLVETDAEAFAKLTGLRERYPDIEIKPFNDDFLLIAPSIIKDIPKDAFSFFFIDPKGFKIRLEALRPILSRQNSESIFNFMHDFINRAASMSDEGNVEILNALIPDGDWRERLSKDGVGSEERKRILVEAFRESLRKMGNYKYVMETAVLRPAMDRTLYFLFYGTRHETGLEVFRDCQVKALAEQSKTRAETKIKRTEKRTKQTELFLSYEEMAPNDFTLQYAKELSDAERYFAASVPVAPESIRYGSLWPAILSKHVVRRVDVNAIATRLRRSGVISVPALQGRARVPKDQDDVSKIG